MFTKRIKIKMIEKDVSGADIARKVGVHRSAINHVINGKNRSPRLRQAIADALGEKYDTLWGEARSDSAHYQS
jgi:transcriptional regulator with XRE-family HTH domain